MSDDNEGEEREDDVEDVELFDRASESESEEERGDEDDGGESSLDRFVRASSANITNKNNNNNNNNYNNHNHNHNYNHHHNNLQPKLQSKKYLLNSIILFTSLLAFK